MKKLFVLCAAGLMFIGISVNGASVSANGSTPAVSADTTSKASKPLSEKVWICTDKTDHTYHLDSDCPLLMNCKRKISEVTLEFAARQRKETPCSECVKKDLTKKK